MKAIKKFILFLVMTCLMFSLHTGTVMADSKLRDVVPIVIKEGSKLTISCGDWKTQVDPAETFLGYQEICVPASILDAGIPAVFSAENIEFELANKETSELANRLLNEMWNSDYEFIFNDPERWENYSNALKKEALFQYAAGAESYQIAPEEGVVLQLGQTYSVSFYETKTKGGYRGKKTFVQDDNKIFAFRIVGREITSGADAVLEKNSNAVLSVSCSHGADLFTGVSVDGTTLTTGDYTTTTSGEERTVVLKTSYLDSLADGVHKLEFIFSDKDNQTVSFTLKTKPQPAKGSSHTVSKNTYKVTKTAKNGAGEVALTGSSYKKSSKKLTTLKIGEAVTIDGVSYKITSIAPNAFKDYRYLKTVVIGSNIKEIGKNAFYGCKGLKKVTIGAKVERIGKKAFYKCAKLSEIKISSKRIVKIESKAFAGIYSKAVIKVPKSKYSNYKNLLKKASVPAKVTYKKVK